MFCKNCGTDLGTGGRNYCPNCGAAIVGKAVAAKAADVSDKSNAEAKVPKSAFLVIGCILLIVAGVIFSGRFIEIDPLGQKEKMLVGSWEGEDFHISFTSDGYAQMGKAGFSFGGNMLTYELLDENTLCLYSSEYPLGIEVGCNITKDYLQLHFEGLLLEFYKD